jgi:hypothetical protein
MSYSKSKSLVKVLKDEKLLLVVALGYGQTKGKTRKTKPIEELGSFNGEMPLWFVKGLEAAQLAPTASNQQKFHFELKGNTVSATTKAGFYNRVDLGIAKYHFELGAKAAGGTFEWAS